MSALTSVSTNPGDHGYDDEEEEQQQQQVQVQQVQVQEKGKGLGGVDGDHHVSGN